MHTDMCTVMVISGSLQPDSNTGTVHAHRYVYSWTTVVQEIRTYFMFNYISPSIYKYFRSQPNSTVLCEQNCVQLRCLGLWRFVDAVCAVYAVCAVCVVYTVYAVCPACAVYTVHVLCAVCTVIAVCALYAVCTVCTACCICCMCCMYCVLNMLYVLYVLRAVYAVCAVCTAC